VRASISTSPRERHLKSDIGVTFLVPETLPRAYYAGESI